MANNSNSRMDTAIKLVLIFFISLLSFAVGTFVGKGVSDSEYRELALEQGEYKTFRQTASVDQKTTEETPKADELTEEDIASLTEEFVSIEKKEVKKQEAEEKPARSVAATTADGYKTYPKAKPAGDYKKKVEEQKREVATYKEKIKTTETKTAEATTTETKAADTKVSHAARRVAKGKAPAKDVTEKRKPTSVLPTVAASAVGKYTVQVASYATEDEARSHAANLKAKGFHSFYVPAEVKGHTWYRVSIGLFSNHKTASSYQQELLQQGTVTSALVQKIVR